MRRGIGYYDGNCRGWGAGSFMYGMNDDSDAADHNSIGSKMIGYILRKWRNCCQSCNFYESF